MGPSGSCSGSPVQPLLGETADWQISRSSPGSAVDIRPAAAKRLADVSPCTTTFELLSESIFNYHGEALLKETRAAREGGTQSGGAQSEVDSRDVRVSVPFRTSNVFRMGGNDNLRNPIAHRYGIVGIEMFAAPSGCSMVKSACRRPEQLGRDTVTTAVLTLEVPPQLAGRLSRPWNGSRLPPPG
jgi:hypothetical protein